MNDNVIWVYIYIRSEDMDYEKKTLVVVSWVFQESPDHTNASDNWIKFLTRYTTFGYIARHEMDLEIRET